jgi:hypothetical protein
MIDKNCKLCKGAGWVCENHLDVPWVNGNECCGGAGAPCVCNPDGELPDGFIVYSAVEGTKVKQWRN